MDTQCHEALPITAIGNRGDPTLHTAIFKSTTPTGVSNDMMLSSARHPAMELAIRRLPKFYSLTWFWSRLQPYCNIMLSAGPLFLSLTLTDFLLRQRPQERSLVQVVNETELAPYMTDLESSTWHTSDAKVLMWIGDRPWIWLPCGILTLLVGFWFINYTLIQAFRISSGQQSSSTCSSKALKAS